MSPMVPVSGPEPLVDPGQGLAVVGGHGSGDGCEVTPAEERYTPTSRRCISSTAMPKPATTTASIAQTPFQ